MAGLTFSRKAPCVAGVSIWDPATCTLLPDSYVFKVRGDTPIERVPEYFDDQDWTEYATDQSQCGPGLVKRGAIKREEVTVTSGYCAPVDGGCLVEGFWWGLEPRVTTRNAQAVADPYSLSFWAYGIAAEAAANLPAGLAALTNGVNANDTHFENVVACSLVPAPTCATVPTASLFVAP
jgi:hypothetical protein